MTSKTLSPTQLNFARFSILCVDIITLPLKDILDIFVKPADLDNRIKACPPLLTGISKLNPDEKKKCCYNSSNTPDYSAFDITLLYKLIRYLCPSLEPPNKWGTKPTVNDVSIGDDIERIRELRNKHFAHPECGTISDDDFMELWTDAKRIIRRCQHFTTSKGCNTDYNQMIVDLQKRTLTFDEYISNVECSGAIYISGDTKVPCGNTAHFEAEISTEQDVYMPLNWDRVDGLVREEINIENKKYEGSDNRNLIINNVCMNDEGGYQAVISRKHDVKILSNRVYLRPKGDLPCLDELNTTTKSGEIYIHYVFNVSDNSPTVNDIKWTIDESFLELSSNKYRGGGLADDRLTILRPGEDDKGLYTCTVSNAVGPVSKSIKLDIPSAEILSTTNLKVMFGSDTRLNCSVSGYPSANKVEWQNSLDGRTFYTTDIDEDKYFGSSSDPCSPFLLVRNATLYDQQYYRVIVSNEIGKYTSNRHFLQVTGGKPNMSEVTCTFQGHSVKLNCGVFLYDESPALNDVYWTKNGMKIDIEQNNRKYSGMNINDPSLTINRVNHNDAGEYQLTAVNAVGERKSEVIVLGVPKVHLEKCDKKEDGSLSFTMTIKSIPVPHAVQWIMKEHGSESVQPINVNVAEYSGTTNAFPHPVLVIKHLERLENCSFEIEVKNRIGEAKARIPGDISQQIVKRKQSTLGKFHIDGGSRVPFSKLLNELAGKFPKEKVNQLKYLIRVSCDIKDGKELDQAKNAADCFTILWKEELITTSNVIAMQFLLQETACEDLEKKCVEFAKKQNAIYYYEKPPAYVSYKAVN